MNYAKMKDDPAFKAKRKAYWATYYAKNRTDLNREKVYRRKYGLSHADYMVMVANQNGQCASCGCTPPPVPDRKRLVVDHDHATGAIRGLLCPGCNIGIGHLGDSPRRLRQAALYLEACFAQGAKTA